MSKESAMTLMTGEKTAVTPSLIAPIPEGAPVTPPKPTDPVEPAKLASDIPTALVKKEARLERERLEVKKEREKLAEQQKWFEEKQKMYQQFEQTKAKDPVEALKLVGFSETEIFNVLSGAQPKELTPEERATQAAQAEIKKFQEQQAAEAKKLQEQKDAQALSNFKTRITKTIDSDPEKYELCKFNGKAAEDLIYETVINVLEQDLKADPENAKPISLTEAADMVEAYYLDILSDAKKLKKLQDKVEAAPAPEPVKAPIPAQKSKTLTNDARITAAATIPKTETRSEKRERLMNMLRQGVTR